MNEILKIIMAIIAMIIIVCCIIIVIKLFIEMYDDGKYIKQSSDIFFKERLERQEGVIDNLRKELAEVCRKYNNSIFKDAVTIDNTFDKNGEKLRIFTYTPKLINILNSNFIRQIECDDETLAESEFMNDFYNNSEKMLATAIFQDIVNLHEVIDIEKFADILKSKVVLYKCND